jgi:transposase
MKNKSKYILETIRLSEIYDNSATVDARLVGVSDKTITLIRRKAKKLGLTYQKAKEMGYKKLGQFFDSKRRRNKAMVMPDWHAVHQSLQSHKHATLVQLHHEYKLQYGECAYAYSQFTHLYREFARKVDISMRQTHHPGQSTFIDFAGKTIKFFDELTGKKKQAYIFVGVLGCSQYTFAWACPGQTSLDWIEGCNQMFQFFGGVSESLVPDNPKAVVTKSGKSLVLNSMFQDMAEHYGIAVHPARVKKPQDKSLAELGVLFVTRWITAPLSRRKYFSIDEINQDIPELLAHLNERKFRRMPGSRKSRFIEMDKPVLNMCPSKPYRRLRWVSEQKVDSTYHIYIEGHAYSLPFRYAHERVGAWIGHKTIEFIHDGLRIAIHKRSFVDGGCTTNPRHRPPSHAAYASRTRKHYLEWARSIGEFSTVAIEAQFKQRPEHSVIALKACENLKDLAKKYDEIRFENACERAKKEAALTVKSIGSILRRKLDMYESDEFLPIYNQSHENIRGAGYFQ